MKICPKCGIDKSFDEFYKAKNTKDGYRCYCKVCITKASKQYDEKNKKLLKIRHAIWYQKNKHRITELIRKKCRTDRNFKLLRYLRTRMWWLLRNKQKTDSTLNLLGCSIKFLKKHLEKQFKPGMSWENYGFYGWHVDHIRPCASFDLSKSEEQIKCFHYSNLQPLWADENFRKNDKITIGEN